MYTKMTMIYWKGTLLADGSVFGLDLNPFLDDNSIRDMMVEKQARHLIRGALR